jgi:nucleoside-diphosphate-sugar epimerase
VRGSRALVLGCGYLGGRLARALVHEGVEVIATTRRADRFGAIQATGARAARVDVLEPSTLEPLAAWSPDVVFDLVRPQPTGEDRYTAWGTRNVANAFAEHPPGALVYLSSTSVYGRRDGEWTDETTSPNPVSPQGEARLEAEGIYRDLHATRGFPVRICRVPGIYGPGRTLRERLESGAYRRLDDDKRYVSRIHVDDLVRGLLAAWRRGADGEVYLLCDDDPVTGEEYAELTADLLGLPLPPAVPREDIRQETSASAYERRIASRRCCNRRMREELGVVPRFPSVREGVPAALREEGVI